MFSSIEIQLQTLPTNPGVYQFYDATDTLIYVGKAVNLKKRVSSYFQKEHDNAKTRILVRKIVRIEHIVVATESDALLLENNLIKKYQPRYNILLKDDKSYPWICVKKERFPRVFSTRSKRRFAVLWPLYQYENRTHTFRFDKRALRFAQL